MSTLDIECLKEVRALLYPIRRKWYSIGIELDIKIGELDTIKATYSDHGECLIEMIKLWLKSTCPPPTWKALRDALKADPVGEVEVSEQVRLKENFPLDDRQTPLPPGKALTTPLPLGDVLQSHKKLSEQNISLHKGIPPLSPQSHISYDSIHLEDEMTSSEQLGEVKQERSQDAACETLPVGAKTQQGYSGKTLCSDTMIYSCFCYEEPVRLTVSKNTSNKDRVFYKCAKPEGKQCKFFIWDDEQPEDIRRAMAHLPKSRHLSSGTSGSGKKTTDRRCSKCLGVGHIKTSTKCPWYRPPRGKENRK